MPEISEYCNFRATNIMTTFDKCRIVQNVGDLYGSLSSNRGSNREIVGGSTYLGKYIPERMN